MADNYTFFSELIGPFTRECILWVDKEMNEGTTFWGDPSVGDFDSPEEHSGWEKYKAWADYYDIMEDEEALSFDWQVVDREYIWIYSLDSGNMDQAAKFMQRLLKNYGRPGQALKIEAAFTCSKPRADEFGGAAAIVTAEKIEFMSTSHWVQEQMKKVKNP